MGQKTTPFTQKYLTSTDLSTIIRVPTNKIVRKYVLKSSIVRKLVLVKCF